MTPPLPYPLGSPLAALYGLALGLLLDLVYPYHRGLLLKIHPVHTCYVLARRLYRPYASRLYGVAEAVACIVVHMAPIAALLLLLSDVPQAGPWLVLGVVTVGVIVKFSLSLRLLVETVLRAGEAGEEEARRLIQGIVRRNVYELDMEHVYSAGLESLAESLVDGYTSPLTWFFLAGAAGALLQRLANTLDGALGFTDPEVRDQGWFSARLDTLLNYLPARLTAIAIILAGLLLGHDAGRALRIYRRYRNATRSVNAGHPMSALAGVLGVTLEKPCHYRLGEGPLPSASIVGEGVRVAVVAAVLYTLAASLVYLALLSLL